MINSSNGGDNGFGGFVKTVEVHALLHRDGTRDRVSGRRIRHHQRVADRLDLRTASHNRRCDGARLAMRVGISAGDASSRTATGSGLR
jgi:hypothetical protein